MNRRDKHLIALATIGGKSKLLDKLIEIIQYVMDEKNLTSFADVFGGGNKLIPNLQMNFERAIYNDIDLGFANLMRCLKDIESIHNMISIVYSEVFEVNSQKSFDRIKYLRLDKATDMERSAAYSVITQYCSRAADRETYNHVKTARGISYEKLYKYLEFYDVMRHVEVDSVDYKHILPTLVNNPKFLIYLDPPYISTDSYANNIDHTELLTMIVDAKASIILSNFYIDGYGDELIQAGWYRYSLGEICKSSSGKKGMTQEEFIWTNFEIPSVLV